MSGSGVNMARNDVVFGSGETAEPGAMADAGLIADHDQIHDLMVADGDLPGVDQSIADAEGETAAPVAAEPDRVPGLLSKLRGPRLTPAITLSFAAHIVLAAALLPRATEDMQIAGGAEVSVTIIGADLLDALKAGDNVDAVATTEIAAETSETLKPVETASLEPVVEPTVEPAVEPVAQPVIEPVTETAQDAATKPTPPVSEATMPVAPVQEDTAIASVEPVVTEAAPVPHVQELAAVADLADDPVAAVPEPAVEDAPDIANVPVPTPRPAPPKTEVAKAVAQQPAPTQVSPKPERRAEPPVRKQQKASEPARAKPAKPTKSSTAAKPIGGDGGTNAATATRGASGAKAAGKASQAGNAAVSNYPGKVASKLRRSLRYPREARGGKLRGEVLVSFVVGSNGSVSSVRVARSSGSPVLDQAAGDAVRRAAPFPPIPANAGRSNWSFSVPLAFTR